MAPVRFERRDRLRNRISDHPYHRQRAPEGRPASQQGRVGDPLNLAIRSVSSNGDNHAATAGYHVAQNFVRHQGQRGEHQQWPSAAPVAPRRPSRKVHGRNTAAEEKYPLPRGFVVDAEGNIYHAAYNYRLHTGESRLPRTYDSSEPRLPSDHSKAASLAEARLGRANAPKNHELEPLAGLEAGHCGSRIHPTYYRYQHEEYIEQPELGRRAGLYGIDGRRVLGSKTRAWIDTVSAVTQTLGEAPSPALPGAVDLRGHGEHNEANNQFPSRPPSQHLRRPRGNQSAPPGGY